MTGTRIKHLLILVLLIGFAAPGFAEPEPGVRWQDLTLEAALTNASRQNKLVMVDCWATWCTFCFTMDRETWAQQDLARLLDKETVAIRKEVDAKRGAGMELQSRYQVKGLPAVLFLHPEDGRLLLHLEGYQSAEMILDALDQARVLAWPEERARAVGEDPASLLRLAGQLHRSGSREESKRALELSRRVWREDTGCRADHGDDAALLIADILEQTKRPALALEALREASEPCHSSGGAQEIWLRLVALERTHGESGRLGGILTRRTELFPQQIEAWLELASWLGETGAGNEKILIALSAAHALDEEDTRPLAALAKHFAGSGEPDRGLDLIEDAIRIDPHDPALREIRLRIVLANR